MVKEHKISKSHGCSGPCRAICYQLQSHASTPLLCVLVVVYTIVVLPHYIPQGVDFRFATATLALWAIEPNPSPCSYFYYCVPASRCSGFWSKPLRLATKPRLSHCVPHSQSTRFPSRPSRMSPKPLHSRCASTSRSTHPRTRRPWTELRLSRCVTLSNGTPSRQGHGVKRPRHNAPKRLTKITPSRDPHEC